MEHIQEKSVLKVKKHYCTLIENSYGADYYLIKMPNSSEYKDYSAQIYSGLVLPHDYFYSIKAPWKDDFLFKLIKNNREPGKRYKQPKLTWEELVQEFNVYDKELDVSTNPFGFAQFNIYDRSRTGVETYEKIYSLGRVDETWFYLENGERHLVSAKNFILIKKYLTEKEINEISNKLNRLDELQKIIDELKGQQYSLFYILENKLKTTRTVPSFNTSTEIFIKSFSEELDRAIGEREKILEGFEKMKKQPK